MKITPLNLLLGSARFSVFTSIKNSLLKYLQLLRLVSLRLHFSGDVSHQKMSVSVNNIFAKPPSSNDLLYKFLSALQAWLFWYPSFLKLLRAARFLLHESPWVKIEHGFNRLLSYPEMETNDKRLFVCSRKDSNRLRALHEQSYVYGPTLQSDVLTFLQNRYASASARIYRNAHLTDRLLFDITHHESIVSVVRDYFGFEPRLHSCNVTVETAGSASEGVCEEDFHYDIVGAKSLNVFIYLSDIEKTSVPHVLIKGSHRNKRLSDICNGGIKREEAENRYGNAIATLIGDAGTTIFENREAFHRRCNIKNNGRVFVNILYTNGKSLIM